MAKAADSEELTNAFREHEKQTKEQVNRLEKVSS
jgi:ferritin-like metal-binding protein YciE